MTLKYLYLKFAMGLLAALLLAMLSSTAIAQTKSPSRSPRLCHMTELCNSMCVGSRDCAVTLDERKCGHEISLFGNRIAMVNDPACEAAKASQNVAYAAQRASCEANKEAERADCERRKSFCLSVAGACADVREKAATSKVDGAIILWVDDHPDNNIYERQALSDLGAKISLASNTQDALHQIQSRTQRISAVISNFGYDPQGGYSRLAAVLKASPLTPYIIYSASASANLIAEAKAKGAFGETNRVPDLFDLIISAVGKK